MFEVSYVATFYNKAEFVADVVGSILDQQGIGTAEIILVDDGSTDDTVERLAIAAASASDVKIIQTENKGPSSAINTGIFAASGRYVKFLDGDDVLRPGATRALIDALEDHDAVCAYGDIIGAPADQRLAKMADLDPRFDKGVKFTDGLQRLVRDWQINPSMLLARGETLKQSGGADTRVFIQDYAAALRLTHLGPIVRLESPVAVFPEAVETRLTANEAQVLHDLNLATALFLADVPDLPRGLRKAFVNRIWERAWKWASRNGGQGLGSRVFRKRTMTRMGLGGFDTINMLEACLPFAETHPIRLTDQGKTLFDAAGLSHSGLVYS